MSDVTKESILSLSLSVYIHILLYMIFKFSSYNIKFKAVTKLYYLDSSLLNEHNEGMG